LKLKPLKVVKCCGPEKGRFSNAIMGINGKHKLISDSLRSFTDGVLGQFTGQPETNGGWDFPARRLDSAAMRWNNPYRNLCLRRRHYSPRLEGWRLTLNTDKILAIKFGRRGLRQTTPLRINNQVSFRNHQ